MHSSPLEDTLRLFGKERFRPMQRELMECALAGRSCIGILPTGSGKSLCYQIPAVLGGFPADRPDARPGGRAGKAGRGRGQV